MVDQTQFFDIFDVLVNEIVGDFSLFIIMGLILVLILALRSNMGYQVSLLMGALWLLIMVAAVTNAYILGLIILGIALFYIFQFRNIIGR